MPAPALVSTTTLCPAATYSRTAPGVRPTRYSCVLISLGTPIFMATSAVWHASFSRREQRFISRRNLRTYRQIVQKFNEIWHYGAGFQTYGPRQDRHDDSRRTQRQRAG